MSTPEVIRAFAAEHIVKITGLTLRQLKYWDSTEFFKSHFSNFGTESPVRIYSFRDAVSLRTLAVLKQRHHVSLQHLREVARNLAAYSNAPFAELRLYVLNRQVYFREPGTGRTRAVLKPQYEMLPIIDVMNEVTRAADSLNTRDKSQYGKVERHRAVSRNAQVIAGTRIPVRTIQHFLADGFSVDTIMQEYPVLTREDIAAVAAGSQKAA